MHHPKQPALTRVRDVRVGDKRARRGDGDITRASDQIIDIVRDVDVVDEPADRAAETEIGVVIELLLACAESGTSEEMFDRIIAAAAFTIRSFTSVLHGPAGAPSQD
jgi:hypothetical protein